MLAIADEFEWTPRALCGFAVGILTFLGSWIYCALVYGYLLGVGLGWLPSLVTGFLAVLSFQLLLSLLWKARWLILGGAVFLVLHAMQ